MTASGRASPRRGPKARDPGPNFDPGRVFAPGDGRDQDLLLDIESARYRAHQGEAGRRGRDGGGPHRFGCRCTLCEGNARFD